MQYRNQVMADAVVSCPWKKKSKTVSARAGRYVALTDLEHESVDFVSNFALR